MGKWRGKILFALIVYGAGFATAIYFLAPSKFQEVKSRVTSSAVRTQDRIAEQNGFDSQAWAASVRVGMSKAMRFAEEQALQIADTVKTRMEQSKSTQSGS